MDITDRLKNLRETMSKAVRQIDGMIARLDAPDDPDVGELPTKPGDPDVAPRPVEPPPVTQPPPARPPPVDQPPPTPPGTVLRPSFRRSYVDPLVWLAAKEDAPGAGLQPVTIVAIQVWESNWYTSKLFTTANNVGGVKYRPDLPALGHTGPPYQATDGNVYASWPSWREGIRGHVQFLRQKRYDGVRATDDALAEIRAIHDAGYAEHSIEWLNGVSGLARKFLAEGH